MTVRPLTAPLAKKAKKEINEVPSRVPTDINTLKDWLRKQPHLESVKPSKFFILLFYIPVLHYVY